MSESIDEINEEGYKRKDKEKERSKKDKKDVKGYVIFGEDESGDELVGESSKSFGKIKKPKSFKFSKKEKEEKKEKKEKAEIEKKDKQESHEQKSKSDKKSKSELEKLEKKLKSKEKKLSKKSGKVTLNKWNKKVQQKGGEGGEESLKVTEKLETVIFGVPLSVAVERNPSHDGIPLPAIVRECIDYISEYGIACEGIYRVSGVKSKVHHLKDLYNAGTPVYLVDHEPYIVSSLLKLFLRELPEPVLTHRLTAKFEHASTIKNTQKQLVLFSDLIADLPTPNQTLLTWVIMHMAQVIEKEKLNKMSLQNLSIVLSPTMKISHRVLNVFLTSSKQLFKDTVLKRYIPPMRPATSKWTLELPESRESLQEELVKQESLLDHIHEGLTKNKHPGLEERLWEVQRVVTQLKRKLKHLKQIEQAESSCGEGNNTTVATAATTTTTASGLASSGFDKKYPSQKLKLIKTLQNSPQVLKRLNDKLPNDPNLDSRLSDLLDHINLTDHAPSSSSSSNHKPHGSFKGRGSSSSNRHSLDRKDSDASRKQTSETKRHSSNVSDRSLKVDSRRSSRLKVDHDKVSRSTVVVGGAGSSVGTVVVGAGSSVGTVVVGAGSSIGTVVGGQKVEKGGSESREEGMVKKGGVSAVEITVVEGVVLEGAVVEAGTVEGGLSLAPKSRGDVVAGEDGVVVVVAEDGVSVIGEEEEEGIKESKRSEKEGECSPEEAAFKRKEPDADATSEISQAETLPYEKLDNDEAEEEISDHDDDDDDDDVHSQPYTIGDGDDDDVCKVPMAGIVSDDDDDEIRTTMCPEQRVVVAGVVAAAGGADDDDDEYRRLGDESMSSIPDLSNIDSSSRSSSQSSSGASLEHESYEHFESLLNQYNYLLMQEEELVAMGDEMRQKIATELNEIERMQQDISELHMMRRNDDSSLSSSSSSSSSSLSSPSFDDDDRTVEEKVQALDRLMEENKTLEEANRELSNRIYSERVSCLEVKLQIRMLQQKNNTLSCLASYGLDHAAAAASADDNDAFNNNSYNNNNNNNVYANYVNDSNDDYFKSVMDEYRDVLDPVAIGACSLTSERRNEGKNNINNNIGINNMNNDVSKNNINDNNTNAVGDIMGFADKGTIEFGSEGHENAVTGALIDID